MAALDGGDLVALGLSSLQLLVYAVPLLGLGVTLARALARLFAGARPRPSPEVPAGAGRPLPGSRGTAIRGFFGTSRARWMLAGMIALDSCLAVAVLTGVVTTPAISDEPGEPVAAALAVPAPTTLRTGTALYCPGHAAKPS